LVFIVVIAFASNSMASFGFKNGNQKGEIFLLKLNFKKIYFRKIINFLNFSQFYICWLLFLILAMVDFLGGKEEMKIQQK
jgi:hypothetical protein